MVARTLIGVRPRRFRPGGFAPPIGTPLRRAPGAWGRRGQAPVIWAGASRHAALDRAKALLDASLAENIPLGRLALLVGLGPSRLSELFRQAEGVGPTAISSGGGWTRRGGCWNRAAPRPTWRRRAASPTRAT